MEIKNLENSSQSEIITCFLEAFSDYYIPMPQDFDYYRQRWKQEGVNFSLSIGAYENQKLLAFILHAVDSWNGTMTAYNACTGVTPTYRGRKLVKQLYQQSIPILQEFGVKQCILEVIQENEKAIKAYQSVGFQISKHYKCYKGFLDIQNIDLSRIESMQTNEKTWTKIPQYFLSWGNHQRSLNPSNFDIYFVKNDDDKEVAYFILHRNKETLYQLGVFEDKVAYWQILLQALATITNKIKIINVDESESSKIEVLEKVGLENFFNQYEMLLQI